MKNNRVNKNAQLNYQISSFEIVLSKYISHKTISEEKFETITQT